MQTKQNIFPFMFVSNALKKKKKNSRITLSFQGIWSNSRQFLIPFAFIRLSFRCFTVEEDEEDARVGELLSTQQVDVLDTEVKGQFDDGAVLHVGGDVRHQSQVLHQTTGLQIHMLDPKPSVFVKNTVYNSNGCQMTFSSISLLTCGVAQLYDPTSQELPQFPRLWQQSIKSCRMWTPKWFKWKSIT